MAMKAIAERIRRDERGVSLIELITVCAVSVIVMLALWAFQDIVLRQSTRVFARVDATQRARTTVEGIQSQLRSACMAENVTPIQPGNTGTPQLGSTDTQIAFLTRYGSAASLTPEKHVIAWTGATTQTLTDTTYPVASGTAPNWTFSSTATGTRTLLDHVTQSGSTPVFRYYSYGTAKDSAGNNYLDASGNPYMILLDGVGTLPTGTTTSTGVPVATNTLPANSPSPLPASTGLSVADAKLASAVIITFRVGAAGKLGNITTTGLQPLTVQDETVLRLTPVPSEGNLPTVPPCA